MKNEFLEEIWRVREKLAARHDFDLHRMVVHLQKTQARHGRGLVAAPPKRRHASSKAALALREEPPPYGGQSGGGTRQREDKTDPDENPLEEIWRIREQIAAECGHDVHRLFKRLKALEAKHKHRLISFAPRKPAKPVKRKRTARPQ